MTVVTEILNGLDSLNKPPPQFLSVLFSTRLVVNPGNHLSFSKPSLKSVKQRIFNEHLLELFIQSWI